jgi:hypothetical protein
LTNHDCDDAITMSLQRRGQLACLGAAVLFGCNAPLIGTITVAFIVDPCTSAIIPCRHRARHMLQRAICE